MPHRSRFPVHVAVLPVKSAPGLLAIGSCLPVDVAPRCRDSGEARPVDVAGARRPSEHPAAPACPEESNLRETARYGCIRAAVGSLIQREPDRSADFSRSSAISTRRLMSSRPSHGTDAAGVTACPAHEAGQAGSGAEPGWRVSSCQTWVSEPKIRHPDCTTVCTIPADAASATMNPSGDLSIARRIVTGRPRHRCAVWLGKGASARVEPGRQDRAVGRLYLWNQEALDLS
jgi:hypothetical protein